MKQILCLLVQGLLAVSVVGAEDLVREFEVGESPELRLKNISGDIDVRVGAANRIRVSAVKEDDRIKVEMTQSGDTVSVDVVYPNNVRNLRGGVRFDIQFPAKGVLDVESVSGGIAVNGVSGAHNIRSVSGDVDLSDLQGSGIRAGSVSGNLSLTRIGPSSIDAHTTSGRLQYEKGRLEGGAYRFSSTSGNILISHSRDASYRISGRTVSGDINHKVGGDIRVETGKYTSVKSIVGRHDGGSVDLKVEVVSGNITLQYDP